jgi:hypothetical protein
MHSFKTASERYVQTRHLSKICFGEAMNPDRGPSSILRPLVVFRGVREAACVVQPWGLLKRCYWLGRRCVFGNRMADFILERGIVCIISEGCIQKRGLMRLKSKPLEVAAEIRRRISLRRGWVGRPQSHSRNIREFGMNCWRTWLLAIRTDSLIRINGSDRSKRFHKRIL